MLSVRLITDYWQLIAPNQRTRFQTQNSCFVEQHMRHRQYPKLVRSFVLQPPLRRTDILFGRSLEPMNLIIYD